MRTMPSLIRWLEQDPRPPSGMVLDIDGVLLNRGRRLPGSRMLFERLRHQAIPFVLLTNDGNHSIEEKCAFFRQAGLSIAPEEIISCGHAIAPLVKDRGWSGQRFFIMGDTGNPCYARAAGLATTRDISRLKECDGVIIGEEHYPWEPVINAVVNFFIDHPAAPLIVPNPDEFYPGPRLRIHIAAGGVARFIRQVLAAYGQPLEPIYLGKPFAPIFQMALAHMTMQCGCNLERQQVWMVGDNLASDITGGRQAGLQTALVLTGVTSRAAAQQAEPQPNLVFDRL